MTGSEIHDYIPKESTATSVVGERGEMSMGMKNSPRRTSALEAAIEDAAAHIIHMSPEQLYGGNNEATRLLNNILDAYMAQHPAASETVKQAVSKLSRTASVPSVRMLPTSTPSKRRPKSDSLDAPDRVFQYIPGMGKDDIIG